MAKVYVARCIVRKNGKQYAPGAIIEGLTDDEIAQGLSQKWLKKVGNDETSQQGSKPDRDSKNKGNDNHAPGEESK